MWETATGKEVRRFRGEEMFYAVAFSPDGRLLAGAGGDDITLVHVWELASGGEARTFTGQVCGVLALAFAPDGRTLASGGEGTVMLWDVSGLKVGRVQRPRSANELLTCWAKLAATRADRAVDAIYAMRAVPSLAVPFLRERLHAAQALDAERLKQLVKDLDNPRFRVRERATAALERAGDGITPALRKCLAEPRSPESRRRLQSVLDNLTHGPEGLRSVRSIQVLEDIDTAEARAILAFGKRSAWVADDAGSEGCTAEAESEASGETMNRRDDFISCNNTVYRMAAMSKRLDDYLTSAREAARLGAQKLQEWRQRFQVHEKARFDLVTDADLASQRAIREFLGRRFPSHGFLGEEESGPVTRPPADGPPTWIVDPLDGTTNYVHDCPMYCVSIGLEMAGQLVVGTVYDPSRDEMFSAARGLGAWLNGRPLRTSTTSRLEETLLSTGFPPDVRGQERTLDWWRYFSLHARSLRRTGSTALNLAYVAAGRFDGYWAFDNHVWDVAGGAVLIEEAGGHITNVDGTPFDPYTPDALASNGPLHPAFLAAFQHGP